MSEFDQTPPPPYEQTPPPQYGQAPPPQYGQAPPPQYGQAPPPQYGQAPPPQYQQAPPQYQQAPPVFIPEEQRMAGFMESYKAYWRNYANFNDRTSRAGYWWVILANGIIGIIFSVILAVTSFSFVYSDYNSFASIPFAGFGIVYYLWSIANIIPGLSLSVRRMHDIGKAWTWILISLIPFVGAIILIVFVATQTKYTQDNRWLSRPQVEKL